MPSVGTKRGSDAWRQRVAEGTRRAIARRREAALIRPRDLDRLRSSGLVTEGLRPLLKIAEQEASELFAALGGVGRVSEQKRILIEDLCAVGVALRGTLAAYLRTSDSELASRIATLAGARRSSLAALGLERLEREVMDLQTYLCTKAAEAAQNTPERENGRESDASGSRRAENARHRAASEFTRRRSATFGGRNDAPGPTAARAAPRRRARTCRTAPRQTAG
jgi:hypothetical protein